MLLDVEFLRGRLFEAAVPLALQGDLADYRARGLLRHTSMLDLNTATQCFLVDLVHVGRQICERVRERLLLANEVGEMPEKDYSPGGTESQGYDDLALCNWLLDSLDDLPSAHKAISGDEQWWSHIGNRIKIDANDADTFVRLAYDAGLFEKGIDFYINRAGLKAPQSWAQAARQASAAYLLCLAGQEGRQNDDAVITGAKNFLANAAADLIKNGQFSIVAHWVKIVYWKPNPQASSPVAALKRVLDLPGVAK